MKLVCGALLGSALLLATASSGFAQDALSWVPSGLYLRGDFGGAFGNKTAFKDNNPNVVNTTIAGGTLATDPGNSVIFGGGVGYRFLPFMRGDLTLDYAPSFQPQGTVGGGAFAFLKMAGSAHLNSLIGLGNL